MFSPDDTIVAIATPPGRGGIGVVRISGPAALEFGGAVLKRDGVLEPRRATFVRLEHIDEVVATYFEAPHSYTGEHVIEISAHGSPVVLDTIVRRAVEAGARLAAPGEFTLRAFLNGKRDLVQAEAVADLINAATPLQARVAFDQLEGTLTRRIAAIDADLFDLIARLEASLDFPDEGYHFIEPAETSARIARVIEHVNDVLYDARQGRMVREGATVVIAGRPNVGKSSLFNVLAGTDRAIVTEVAGTTRDLITERVDIDGLSVTLVDTAGWRETADIVEREGVARATQARAVADVLLVVLDASEPLRSEDEQLLDATASLSRIVVANKIDRALGRLQPAPTTDLTSSASTRDVSSRSAIDVGAGDGTALVAGAFVEAGCSRPAPICVSAITREGIPELRRAIVAALTGRESLRDTVAISNTRHVALLEQARASLVAARDAASTPGTTEEFVLADLQAARARFDEIVGVRTQDDVLEHIFACFCIGK